MNPIKIEVEYGPGYQDPSRQDWLHVRVETKGRTHTIHEIVHHSCGTGQGIGDSIFLFVVIESPIPCVAISTLEFVWDRIFRCLKDAITRQEDEDGTRNRG